MVEFVDKLPPINTIARTEVTFFDPKLQEVEKLAKDKMLEWGLEDWKFEFDNAKRRYGNCNYHTRTISISRHLVLLNSYEETLDTILHEIAHAS